MAAKSIFANVGTAIAFLLVCALGYVIFLADDIEVQFTETQVAEQIEAQLPLTFTKAGLEIIVRDADVDFLTENAVRIRADADVSGYGLAGSAIADMTTSITYRDGDFFLTSVAFDDIKFIQDAATEEKLEDGNSVARGLFNTMRDAIADGETGVGAALDRVADRAMDNIIPIGKDALETVITHIPIYSLNGKDYKQTVAAMALASLTFDDTSVIATLSPAQLVVKILMGIALVGLAGILAFGFVFGGGRGFWGW